MKETKKQLYTKPKVDKFCFMRNKSNVLIKNSGKIKVKPILDLI